MRTRYALLQRAVLACMAWTGQVSAQDQEDMHALSINGDLDAVVRPSTTAGQVKLVRLDSLCDPDHLNRFWSLDGMGVVRQWAVLNGSVSGGDTLLTDVPGRGLAYCSVFGLNTFITSDSGRITRYESGNWIDHVVADAPRNLGGANAHLYFMTDLNQTLGYFDGVTATGIAEAANMFTIADVAVHANGTAFLFAGAENNNTTSIDLYNSAGTLVNSYPLALNSTGAYGSFMLGDVFYAGFGAGNTAYANTLVPFTFAGSAVTMGVPIPFDNDGVQLYDLASCAMLLTDGIADGAAPQREPTAYPTPADAYVRITLPNDLLPAGIDVRLTDALGRIVPVLPQKRIGELWLPTAQLPAGIYNVLILCGQHQRSVVRIVVEHG